MNPWRASSRCRQNCHLVKLHNADVKHTVQLVFVQFDVVTDGHTIFPAIIEKIGIVAVTTKAPIFKYRNILSYMLHPI